MTMTPYEQRRLERQKLEEQIAKQKAASEKAPNYNPADSKYIMPEQPLVNRKPEIVKEVEVVEVEVVKEVVKEVEVLKEVEVIKEVTKAPQTLISYIYEHATPTNIILSIGALAGLSALGYSYRNEIYNLFRVNNANNPGQKNLTPIQLRAKQDEANIHGANVKLFFDGEVEIIDIAANNANAITDNTITLLRNDGHIQTEGGMAIVRKTLPTLIREYGAQYHQLTQQNINANYNKADTVKGQHLFDAIFDDNTIPNYEKIGSFGQNNLNIRPGIITKAINSAVKSKGMSKADHTAMYNFIRESGNDLRGHNMPNANELRYLTYLMYKIVYGKNIENQDQNSINDNHVIDDALTDCKIAANEEVARSETSPNIEIYSKIGVSFLLDVNTTPTWEMLEGQLTCHNSLKEVSKEAPEAAEQAQDEEVCPAIETSLTLTEKAILAYKPGIFGITLKTLQTAGFGSTAQAAISTFINSGSNPYVALANQLLLPLSQNALIGKLCETIDNFFADQAAQIKEETLVKVLLEEALGNMSIEEMTKMIAEVENSFTPEWDDSINITAKANHTDDAILPVDAPIILELSSNLLGVDYQTS